MAGLSRELAVTAALSLPAAKEESPPGYLFLASRQGRVKRVTLADLTAARTAEITVMNVDEGDKLGWAARTAGGEEVVLVVSNGQAIRFAEEEVRPMGLPAAGVMGVKMAANDRVVGMGVVRPRGDVVVISEMGIGKRSALTEYPTQGRYGTGVVTASLSSKMGRLAAGAVANVSDRLLMGSEKGNNKVVYVRSLPKARRAMQGQELIAIRGQDRLAALLLLPPMEIGETPEAEAVSEKPTKKTPRPRASGDGQKPKVGKTQSSGKKGKAGGKSRSTGKKTDSPSAGQKKAQQK